MITVQFRAISGRRTDMFLGLVARALSRLSFGSIKFFRYRLVAQPVPTGSLSRQLSIASSTRIYQAPREDPVFAEFPRAPAVIKRRFAQGAHCFVALRAGRLAGFIWIAEGQYFEDEVRCEFRLDPESRMAWDFDVFIAPEFRASRLFVQLWDQANDFLRSRGYRWTASRIAAQNLASLGAHGRLGLRDLGTANFLIVGRLQFLLSRLAPRFHISLGDASYPVLLLRAADDWSLPAGG